MKILPSSAGRWVRPPPILCFQTELEIWPTTETCHAASLKSARESTFNMSISLLVVAVLIPDNSPFFEVFWGGKEEAIDLNDVPFYSKS